MAEVVGRHPALKARALISDAVWDALVEERRRYGRHLARAAKSDAEAARAAYYIRAFEDVVADLERVARSDEAPAEEPASREGEAW